MRKLSTIFLISIFVLGASLMVFNNLSYANEEEWQTVGGPSISGGRAWSPSLAFDSNNIPYVAYQDSSNTKATVKKFNGNTWETVGSAGFSTGGAVFPSLVISNDNTPYIAFIENDKSTVMKFNGTNWQTVGSAGFSEGLIADSISLGINSNDIPYVAYQDVKNGYKATVMKFNGNTWQTVGSAGFSNGQASDISLALDNANIPYVAFRNYNNKATVMKFNGTDWQTVGSAGFSEGAISSSNSSLRISSDNVPYFAYTDDNNAKKVTVKKFNGVAWQTVGNAGFSSDITNGGQTNYRSLAINNNIPYVVYVNDAPGGNNDDDTASVMKFNGNSWEFVGGDNFHSKGISWTFLAINSNGIPYVAFTDTDNNYEIAVMKFICNKDIWSCSEWSTCTINGTQTRSCSMTFDCISASTPSPATTQSCTYIPSCTSNDWSCTNWNSCSSSGTQTRTCNKISNCQGGVSSPATSQSCTYIPPVCTSWTYSGWSTCSASGQQTRTVSSSLPSGCTGGSPVLSQSCNYIPICTANDWSCNSWSSCSTNGTQTRTCNKTSNCQGGVSSPATSQSCTYVPTCTSYSWSCGSWSSCSSSGAQTRACSKNLDCEGGELPKLTQSCTYTPPCNSDTWQCGNWGTCSPQGIQTRTCTRTYDCPSAETAAPATSQYCVAPNQPKQQSPTEDLGIVNQDSIIKSTVKLICPVSSTMASQGSGTVIDSKGTILTNKHVIDGTAGCWVGFIDDYDDEPYFGDRQIADIYKISSDADVAVLKLRNPSNKTLTSINISQSNSGGIKLGEILTTYGYPAKFGTKITYTSGDFSGVDGNYLKTTAIIEHGNSGGGAYLKNGAFIGIPTAVIKGSLNSMGYLLSVDKVNSWLNNSVVYNYNNNNNYSRVSALLEDMDLNAIGSLGLFVAGDEANIKTETESQKVIAEEKKLITKIDNSLAKRMNGNILLQVEKNGEGWYVYPDDKRKYYLGRPADAFSIMRNLGLGIKHSELASYLNAKFPSRLSGKIVLDVEKKGEAYYINPKDLKGYFLSRPADAFKVMRELGLGITNADIRKIGVGEIK